MVDNVTKRFLNPYTQMRSPTGFLMRLGTFDPTTNVYDGEKVTLDIMREDEDISIAQFDKDTGYREISGDLFTNKEFTPPSHKDAITIKADGLNKRQFNQNPFDNPDVVANAARSAARGVNRLRNRIVRSNELQMSQVLQTGTVTLLDNSGNTVYAIDYKPKATHFPTVGTAWGTGGADPRADLGSLAEVIRNDGKVDSTDLIFGRGALRNFIADPTVKELLDNRRMTIGSINPRLVNSGATFYGTIWIDQYQFNLWLYSGRYKDPQTGNMTTYIEDDKVVMLSAPDSESMGESTGRTRIDLTYGRHHVLRDPLPEARQFIPRRINDSGGLSLDINAWFSEDGTTLKVGVGTRPLVIPTGIDTFGCLDTQP